jgi:hypothetical protein
MRKQIQISPEMLFKEWIQPPAAFRCGTGDATLRQARAHAARQYFYGFIFS